MGSGGGIHQPKLAHSKLYRRNLYVPVSAGKWIFGGAHWGHTSLECDSKRPQTSASFVAGQGSFLTLTRWSRDGTNFVRLTGQLIRPALRHLRRKSWTARFNVMRHLRSWRLRAKTTALMLSAFTPTSSSVTMLSLTLTGCLANLIGHAEAAEQDRGRRGKIRRLGVLAFCGAPGAARFRDRCGHTKHPC